MSTFIKRCVVALVVFATVGSGAKASWGMGFPPLAIPAPDLGAAILAPVALVGALVAIGGLVSLIQSSCDDLAEADAAAPAADAPAVPYDPDCLRGETGAAGCIPALTQADPS
jgi:hypothetical protein